MSETYFSIVNLLIFYFSIAVVVTATCNLIATLQYLYYANIAVCP